MNGSFVLSVTTSEELSSSRFSCLDGFSKIVLQGIQLVVLLSTEELSTGLLDKSLGLHMLKAVTRYGRVYAKGEEILLQEMMSGNYL